MFPCNVSCIGLYADVQFLSYTQDCDPLSMKSDYERQLCSIQEEYHKYKNSYAKNLVFMYEEDMLTTDTLELIPLKQDNTYMRNYPSLQFFEIYFDTATYDQIDRDVKVNIKSYYDQINFDIKGDTRGGSWPDWRHHGSLHWILNSKRHRDHLLCR